MIPDELDELVFQVAGDGDDFIEAVSPSDEDTLIALADDDVRKIIRHMRHERTMKAPHCSLSAFGNQLMFSST